MTVDEPIFSGETKRAHDADDATTNDSKKGDETARHATPLIMSAEFTTASMTPASQETLSRNEGLSSSPTCLDDKDAATMYKQQEPKSKHSSHVHSGEGEPQSVNADAGIDVDAKVDEAVASAQHTARVEKLRAELNVKKGWDRPNLGADQFGYYMHEKQRKLREQFAAEGRHHITTTTNSKYKVGSQQQQEQSQQKQNSGLFQGVTVWVDGRTSPSRLEIRRLVMQGGGQFETYFTSRVTHVVADCLAAATKKRWLASGKTGGTGGGGVVTKFVTGRWIKRCVEDGARVPERDFVTPGMVDKSQKFFSSMFSARGGKARGGGGTVTASASLKPSSVIQKKTAPSMPKK